MRSRHLCVLLPGFDGNGRLFAPLLAESPLWLEPRVVALPTDAPRGYDELEEWLWHRLPTGRPFALLAESFSGPLAVRVAARRPRLLTHLVLAATFLRSPLQPWLAPFGRLACPALFTWPPPALAVRILLAGWDAAPSLVAAVRDTMANLPPEVAAARARAALSTDARSAFARVEVPTLWIEASADRLLGPGHVDDALASRPGVRAVRIEGPHTILQRRPRACLAEIARFFDASGRAAGR